MRTGIFHTRRVLTAAGSPVARIEAVDAEGHEVRLEVPTQALEAIAPGHLLVLQWSVHPTPGALADTRAPAPASTARPDPAAVDQEFMALWTRGRSAAAAPTAQGRGIDQELNTLLGTAEPKGQK